MKKVTGMFGNFQVFCVVGIERKIEKIPKISVIFTLPRFVGSERNFLRNAAPELAKNMFSPSRETAGRKATFQSLVSRKRAETAASIALFISRRVGIVPFCGADIAEGSQNAPPEL